MSMIINWTVQIEQRTGIFVEKDRYFGVFNPHVPIRYRYGNPSPLLRGL